MPKILDDDTYEIVKAGHPTLAKVAEDVLDPTSLEIKAIVERMIRTAEAVPGGAAGLAASQVDISLRIFIYRDGDGPFRVAINSSFKPVNSEKVLGWEGCLSWPGLMGEVPRYKTGLHTYTTLSGEKISEEVSDFEARVVQHEGDHTLGIMYPQHIVDIKRFGYAAEVQEHMVFSGDIVDIDGEAADDYVLSLKARAEAAET
jgi:peptide deformylase